jgi:predicted metalloprotease with PDZ domain
LECQTYQASSAFAPYALDQENYTTLLWLFEGFTSYYDDLILLRSGVIDDACVFEAARKNINGVHRSRGRFKQSVAESSFDAWTKYYRQDENARMRLLVITLKVHWLR